MPIRVRAVSELVARLVEQEEEAVKQFRSDVIGGKLLTRDQVEPWVKRQMKKDGPPTLLLTVALPPAVDVRIRNSDKGLVPEKPLTISENSASQYIRGRSRW